MTHLEVQKGYLDLKEALEGESIKDVKQSERYEIEIVLDSGEAICLYFSYDGLIQVS